MMPVSNRYHTSSRRVEGREGHQLSDSRRVGGEYFEIAIHLSDGTEGVSVRFGLVARGILSGRQCGAGPGTGVCRI
jgi:hypothetical protein